MDVMLTPEEVAAEFGIDVRATSLLPHYRLSSRTRRFERDDVVTALATDDDLYQRVGLKDRPVYRIEADESESGFVYFFRAEPGPIKIGFSDAPVERLAAFRRYLWCDVECLATIRGGKRLEAKLHSVFAHLRLRGEWFSPGAALMAAINALAERRTL
jgi:hypothetical protein